ncbi:MAG: HAMP domain-containing sensor histidine kinase [Bacteroidota bacterium]
MKRKAEIAINLFCLACHACFGVNYFFNAGISGPNLMVFSVIFLVVVSIIPKKSFKIWIPINIGMVLSILVIEYLYPTLAPNVYSDEISRMADFAVTYLVVLVLTYFTITYIRKNYDYERYLVLEKNQAIEEQNARILIQKEELKYLNSEKDKLLSIVSHDIKLPLNSIQSYLEVLTEMDLGDDERQEVERQLLQITRDTSEMLMNILSWSKTQMEGAHTQLTVVDVNEVLTTSLRIEHNLADRKEITLRVEIKDKLHIIADPNMFQLVIRNLVNNAIKFTQKGGLINITAEERDNQCLIVVKDNGLGIKDEQKEKLFKLKASSTYGTNKEKGIGLGLLLCKEFTDLQGGTIGFESKDGEGSSFYLYFKLSKSI